MSELPSREVIDALHRAKFDAEPVVTYRARITEPEQEGNLSGKLLPMEWPPFKDLAVLAAVLLLPLAIAGAVIWTVAKTFGALE